MGYTFVCPHCGKPVELDENGYAEVVRQIRDDVFQKDLEQQRQTMEADKEAAVQLAKAQMAMEYKETGTP